MKLMKLLIASVFVLINSVFVKAQTDDLPDIGSQWYYSDFDEIRQVSMHYGERAESVSSFEFQAQLILEKIIMDVVVGDVVYGTGGYVQAVAIKNLCYAMCWRGRPFWDYIKSTCGYLCCTRKTNYCRDSDGVLVQDDPSLVIEGDGDCVNQTFCWGGENDGKIPKAAECVQHECLYEVILNDDIIQ